MRRWIVTLGLALFVIEARPTGAQNVDVTVVAGMADAFLLRISRGEIDEAYDIFLTGSTIDAVQVAGLKEKTKSGLPLYGPSHGHDLVRQEAFGTSVIRLLYLLKCQQHPITWEFYFYKTNDRWIVSSLKFMDTFDLLVR